MPRSPAPTRPRLALKALEARDCPALAVTPIGTAAPVALVNALLAGNPALTVDPSTITYTGAGDQAGTYTGLDFPPTLSLGNGILLTTGGAAEAVDNNAPGQTAGTGGGGSDPALSALIGDTPTNDTNALEFEFTVGSDIRSLVFDFVFGSEEFPEFVGSFNDVFAIFLDGQQVAMDTAGQPITVNNNFFLLNNTDPDDTSDPDTAGKTVVNLNGVEYDGLTPRLTTSTPITPGRHRIRFAIADASDSILDSGAFITSLRASTTAATGPTTALAGAGAKLTAFTAGAGGSATVRVFNDDGSLRFVIGPDQTFGTDFRGGGRVAVGDLTGDGTDDIAVVPGSGGGPVVLVFDGTTGQEVKRFELSRLGGVDQRSGFYVAIGNVKGDARPELVVTPGSTAGPIVDVVDYATGEERAFMGYDPNFRGGLRVAVGDVDFAADGLAEIVVTPGPTGGPVVTVFHAGNLQPDGTGAAKVNEFMGLDDPNYRGGAFVSVASSASRRSSVIAVTRDSFPDFAGTFLEDTLPDQNGQLPAAPLGADQLARNPADLAVNLYTFNGSMSAPPVRASVPVLVPSPTGARVAFGVRGGQPGLFAAAGPQNGARAEFYTLDLAGNSINPVATPVDVGFGASPVSVYVASGGGTV